MAKKKKKAKKSGPYEHSDDNGKTVLNCCTDAEAKNRTADPFDRAHLTRSPNGRLYPAAVQKPGGRAVLSRACESKPRRYPNSAMTSRGVAHDSQFDGWHETRMRLGREGIELGGHRMTPTIRESAMHREARLGDDITLRDILEQTTTQDMTPAELALERQADAMLAAAGD